MKRYVRSSNTTYNTSSMKAIKRDDGLYDVYTEAGFIGTVMQNQLEKAKQILEKDIYGINFYKKLRG